MKALALITIALLTVAVVWLGSAVVRLENYRYGNFVGLCANFAISDPQQRIKREACLESAESRTNWAWHLLYGLKVL
jgi:hypothetical protein